MNPILKNPEAVIKKITWSERKWGQVHGITVRNDQYKLMICLQNNDTIDVSLFNNNEGPLPHTDIANGNSDIITELVEQINTK